MRRTGILAVVVGLASASPALAQDPVQVDPKHYKVEIDNDQVRVLRVRIGPKETVPMHEHPPGVVIPQTGGRLRVTLPGGQTEETLLTAGSVRYRQAIKHAVENLTESTVEIIEVELKRKN